MVSLLNALFGDYDLAAIQDVAPITGTILMVSFLAVVVVLLLNLLIAILSNTYSTVEQAAGESIARVKLLTLLEIRRDSLRFAPLNALWIPYIFVRQAHRAFKANKGRRWITLFGLNDHKNKPPTYMDLPERTTTGVPRRANEAERQSDSTFKYVLDQIRQRPVDSGSHGPKVVEKHIVQQSRAGGMTDDEIRRILRLERDAQEEAMKEKEKAEKEKAEKEKTTKKDVMLDRLRSHRERVSADSLDGSSSSRASRTNSWSSRSDSSRSPSRSSSSSWSWGSTVVKPIRRAFSGSESDEKSVRSHRHRRRRK